MRIILCVFFILCVGAGSANAQDTTEIEITIAVSGASKIENVCKRFAATKGWAETVEVDDADNPGKKKLVANPDTACAYAERYLENFVKEEIKMSEAAVARRVAGQAELDKIEAELKSKKTEDQRKRPTGASRK